MLVQTKRAIENLQSAGLRRNEFRVRVTTTKAGEYGDLKITLFCSTEKAVEVSPALAKHFTVEHLVMDGKVRFVSVTDGVPGLNQEVI